MVNRADLYQSQSIEDFIDTVYEKGWTDGLPVFPPTPSIVNKMLEFVGRDPDEVIGNIFPGEGEASVEKIAINCAMAGCKAEYLPVILSAVEALVDPEFLLNPLQSTGGPTLMTIVSGSIVEKLAFNTREWIFGGNGGRANATIGRALRLIMWNIGGAHPGQLLKGTMGHPGGWSYCIGEEQELNPWGAYHKDYGFDEGDDVVTVMKAGTHLSLAAASGHLSLEDTLVLLSQGLGRLGPGNDQRVLVMVINPSYAQLLADAGYTRQGFKAEMADRSMSEIPTIRVNTGVSSTVIHGSEPVDASGKKGPVITNVDQLHIVIGGGVGAALSQCAVISAASNVGIPLIMKKISGS